KLLVERPESREVAAQPIDDELRELLGTVEILQPPLAEVAEADARRQLVLDEVARRAREQHLSAVSCSCDPRRLVHAEADVSVLADTRLAGMQAHPHPYVGASRPAVCCEVTLRVDGGGDSVLRPPEGDEERVSLRIDF